MYTPLDFDIGCNLKKYKLDYNVFEKNSKIVTPFMCNCYIYSPEYKKQRILDSISEKHSKKTSLIFITYLDNMT